MARLLKTMSHTTISTLWIILWIFAHGAKTIDSFIPATTFDRSTILRSSANSSQSLTTREIKDELKAMDVSFADCFDKESLLQRLHEARENSDIGGNTKPEGVNDDRDDEKQHENQSEEARPARTAIAIDLEEIRAMRVRELREELASRSIRWAGLLEKEDLVQAVYEARKKAAIFSATGTIAPGEVGELTGEQLEAEMMKTSPPLLLDAYATWCKYYAESDEVQSTPNDRQLKNPGYLLHCYL